MELFDVPEPKDPQPAIDHFGVEPTPRQKVIGGGQYSSGIHLIVAEVESHSIIVSQHIHYFRVPRESGIDQEHTIFLGFADAIGFRDYLNEVFPPKLYPSRIEQLRHMPYSDYLQTPEWKRRRSLALERANHKCQLCGKKNRLEVHHNSYEHLGNEHDLDLVVLCARCHSHHHGHLPRR